jgi:hypothetical protein
MGSENGIVALVKEESERENEIYYGIAGLLARN